MTHPNTENIKRAIEDVQQVYDELHAQLLVKYKEADELKDRLAKLEAFINPAKALLGLGKESGAKADEALPKAASLQPSSFVPPLPLIEKPLLQGGIEILKEIGRPMHLTDIVQEFRRRRWKLSEKNGKEVLRFTFRKHIGTIFVKTKKGLYDLKDRSEQIPSQSIIRRAYR